MAVPFSIKERGGLLELDTAAFFLHLLELRRTGVSVPDLARRFHLGLAEGLADLALSGARRCGVRTVALSGGVFHNRTIALLLPEALARRGLVPLTHHALPPGDGGLSYGQAAWASHVLRLSLIHISIGDHRVFSRFDFSSLRTGIMAGSVCPEPLMRRVMDQMCMSEITICYGLTEGSPVMTQTRTDDTVERRVKTVGRSMPGIEVTIRDPETNEEVPRNAVGLSLIHI